MLDRWGPFDNVEGAPNVVTPVEARLGPWSGNNNLGHQVPFRGPVGYYSSILRMPEYGPPRVRTVNLAVSYDDAPRQGSFAIFARVTIGAGGTSHEFDVDWANGVQFSAPMNSLDVTAHWDELAGEVPNNLILSAMVGDGGSVHRLGATRTQQGGIVASGATGPVHLIPRYARNVRVMNGPNVVAPGVYDPLVSIQFLAEQAGAPFGSTTTSQANLATDGISFPNRAKLAQLVNGSINPFDYYLQWELAL